jgi:hypothetical protein
MFYVEAIDAYLLPATSPDTRDKIIKWVNDNYPDVILSNAHLMVFYSQSLLTDFKLRFDI